MNRSIRLAAFVFIAWPVLDACALQGTIKSYDANKHMGVLTTQTNPSRDELFILAVGGKTPTVGETASYINVGGADGIAAMAVVLPIQAKTQTPVVLAPTDNPPDDLATVMFLSPIQSGGTLADSAGFLHEYSYSGSPALHFGDVVRYARGGSSKVPTYTVVAVVKPASQLGPGLHGVLMSFSGQNGMVQTLPTGPLVFCAYPNVVAARVGRLHVGSRVTYTMAKVAGTDYANVPSIIAKDE